MASTPPPNSSGGHQQPYTPSAHAPSSPFLPRQQSTPQPRPSSRSSAAGSSRSNSPNLTRSQFSPIPAAHYRSSPGPAAAQGTPQHQHHHHHHGNQYLAPTSRLHDLDEFGLDDDDDDDEEGFSAIGADGEETGGGVFIDLGGGSVHGGGGQDQLMSEHGQEDEYEEEEEEERRHRESSHHSHREGSAHPHDGIDDDDEDDMMTDVDGGAGNSDITSFSEFEEDGAALRAIREGGSAYGQQQQQQQSPAVKVHSSEQQQQQQVAGRPFTPTRRASHNPHTPQSSHSPSHFQNRAGASRQGHSRTSSRSSMVSSTHFAGGQQTANTPTPTNNHHNLNSNQATPVPSNAAQNLLMMSSPTPSTPLLLDDFTMQFNAVNNPTYGTGRSLFSASPSGGGGATPRGASRSDTISTPLRRPPSSSSSNGGGGGGANSNSNPFLLDFDIPAPPTPRSIPTMTLREVETLKATYLTQLAELKSQVLGKDAEANSLRHALQDAESRCGALREEVDSLASELAASDERMDNFREGVLRQVESERRGWDEERGAMQRDAEIARIRFGREVEDIKGAFGEMERMVNDGARREDEVRAELEGLRGEYSKLLVQKQQQEEHFREFQHQVHLQQEQHKLQLHEAEMQGRTVAECSRCTGKHVSDDPPPPYPPPPPPAGAPNPTQQAQSDATKSEVDRIAKELHILYKQKHETKVAALKARWEKKIRGLEGENERLRTQQQTNPPQPPDVAAMKAEIEKLRVEVEKERKEKGDLVGAVEEMLALQMRTLKDAAKEAEMEEIEQQQQQEMQFHQQQQQHHHHQQQQEQEVPRLKLMSPVKTAANTPGKGKPGTLKVKDVKKLERGWEGVRRRASGIGLIPPPQHGAGAPSAGGGGSGIAPPREGGYGIGRGGFGVPAGGLRGGIERMGNRGGGGGGAARGE
ncbi:hypothetical protein DFH27DRAFT_561856, partial [Peziza echinospora]